MDLDRPRDIVLSCGPGLVPMLQAEVEAMSLPVVSTTRTLVTTHGDWQDAWRLCLELRTASNVLYPLETFRCDGPDDLYRHARSMDWASIVPVDGFLTVESRVDHPSITNSMFPNVRLKDAIVDRIAAELGQRPDSGPEPKGVVVHLNWKGDRATISLNAAGRKLPDRSYRYRAHRAPLRESLAAGIVLASGWRGETPLVLPMCGSGTLAIEAALIGLDRAPGLLRKRFAFEQVIGHDAEAFTAMRRAIRKRSRRVLGVPIVASDIDPEAIEAARSNAHTAGVDHLVDFHVCDFAETPMPEPVEVAGPASGPASGPADGAEARLRGTLIVNPEYGTRLGDARSLEPLYDRLGSFFKKRCAGWNCFVLSGNADLTRHIGLRASRRIPLFNASIECRLLRYEMW